MKKKVIFVFFIGLWLLYACNRTTEKKDCVFGDLTDLSDTNEERRLSELFVKYKLVRLETNDSCLIGRNGKILKRDSIFYIQSANDILKFDSDGHFIGKLSHVGSAPHEYVQLYDFDVLTINGLREVWISTYGGIKVYDAHTSSFKRSINVDGHVNQFKYVNDKAIVIVTPEDITFKICDVNGRVRQSYMKKDLANSGRKIVQFMTYGEKILYHLDDTQEAVVYDVAIDSIYTGDMFQTQEKLLTSDVNREYYEQYGFDLQYKKVAETFTRLSAIRIYRDHILLTMKHPKGRNTMTVFDSKKCHTYSYSQETSFLHNDIISSMNLNFLSTLICCDSDSGFLFMIPANDIKSETGVLEDDNPILLDVSEVI